MKMPDIPKSFWVKQSKYVPI